MAGMNKPRIVADNAASRATLTASSTAGALLATNLQIDEKESVWRATGTSATLTLTWPALELLSCFALAFCNLSPTETIRVRGYSDAAGNTQVLDTGAVLASPAPAVKLRGWTPAQAASAYANGGGALACVWFAPVSVMRLVVDIVDTNNLQGYIEAACVVVGAYWTPAHYASGALAVTPATVDTTELYRVDSGGQRANAGYIYRSLPIDLSIVSGPDRADMVDILRNSRAYPILVSIYPGAADPKLERDHMIYGRRAKDSDIAIQYALAYSTTIPIEEI